MRKLRLYLDTSIINFALADDINEKDKEGTRQLCKEINQGKYEGFISEVVIREINNTKDSEKQKRLINYVEKITLSEILEGNNEVDILAQKYISEQIIPARYEDDALHIALATVNEIDILVSWNFKHLVKHKTRIEVNGVNNLMGYRNIDICTPLEVIEDV
ncbi:MAG: type II toxin-antitoxin system VapC family toxin [Candidatus Omnitrophica bacterium]|nr:type II toxin-antitoxin system VapC family toxin [Candidatus Omnitrophota bacterium]